MRPQRLVMEGFLAYRNRTEVDFGDADLFVLSGPTGAGKSSVIDGIVFALYGTIPRLDDRRSVAPVISARSDRACVSFRFSVGDEVYTAVRLVERRGGGATTTEARLLRGEEEEPLAGNADEVTDRVAELLGLSYSHFVKAVVLPQGAFADFLTDRPNERQALLRALLDLGLFEQVMQLANLRARTAESRAEAFEEALAKLDVPTEEQIAEVRDRLTAMNEAAIELPSRVEVLTDLETAAAAAADVLTMLRLGRERLLEVTLPSDVPTLIEDRAKSNETLAPLVEAMDAAADTKQRIDETIATHPPIGRLEAWSDRSLRLAGLREDREAIDLVALGQRFEKAGTERDEVQAELNALIVEQTAHRLRQGLAKGDACPVCGTIIVTAPDGDHGWDPAHADELTAHLAGLERSAAEERDRLKEAEGTVKQIDRAIADLETELADAPPPETLQGALETVRGLLEERARLEGAESAAREAVETARAAASGMDERAALLRQELLEARDLVVSHGPPLPGDDAVAGWLEFEEWRKTTVDQITTRIEDQESLVDAGRKAVAEAVSSLGTWLTDLGVQSTGSPQTDLALAIERRGAEVRDLEKALTDAADLEGQLAAEQAKARVAAALGNHLRANNFERWVLEEAMEILIQGANQLLEDLSGGSYSLRVKDSQFQVVDHRNARLTRTTRSLSGGETFLVALSLALSMAEQLAELTGTASRLESVFLDEGFGSLDQESLDVVATVLDELVGRGRMVGIVTHVRDLADRIPVRFEVTKGPDTSSILRVGE